MNEGRNMNEKSRKDGGLANISNAAGHPKRQHPFEAHTHSAWQPDRAAYCYCVHATLQTCKVRQEVKSPDPGKHCQR